MPLYRLKVYFETDDPADVDALTESFERAICPFHADISHACPHRWMITSVALDEEEALALDDLLNS